MPVLVRCIHCQAPYQVPHTALGRQAKCTKCGERFSLVEKQADGQAAQAATVKKQSAAPAKASSQQAVHATGNPSTTKVDVAKASPTKAATSPAVPAPPKRLTEKELLAAFREPFPPRRPRLTYRFGILLAALTMIVLPLIYLAFIGLVGFGVYYHARYDTALLAMGHGRARIFAVLIYAAPIVAGTIAVLFMFKPLLARPSKQEQSRSLTRQSEPLLFTFIDRICEEVGAPQPRRIDVDCNVNASASFRRGMLSMFGHDLVLTIGLPLAAGLSLREFAGVMAHELGHFGQGMGMRLSYLVRSIVHWFVRVVYQRDEWDDWLQQTAEELDFRIGWMFLLGQLFVYIGRGILWVLLHIGLAVSGIMLRQMEYDADSYEARLAGSTAFASTVRKLHLLNGASNIAQNHVSVSLQNSKLVDNFPGLIRYHANKMQREALPHIEEAISKSKTGWFDSHPCDKDRVAAAEKLACPGIFQTDRPASDLFTDFNTQASAASWNLYLGIFGPKVPRTALQPIQQFVVEHKM